MKDHPETKDGPLFVPILNIHGQKCFRETRHCRTIIYKHMRIVLDSSPEEKESEIINILECIISYQDEDPVRRSDYFRVIQKKTEKALEHLEQHPLIIQ